MQQTDQTASSLPTSLQLTAGTLPNHLHSSQTDRSSLFLDAVARFSGSFEHVQVDADSIVSRPVPFHWTGPPASFFKLRFAAAPPRFAPRLPPQQESESIRQTPTDKSHWATPRTRLTVPLWRATDTRRLLPASQLYRGPALLCHINPSGAHEGRIQNIATQHRFVHASTPAFPYFPVSVPLARSFLSFPPQPLTSTLILDAHTPAVAGCSLHLHLHSLDLDSRALSTDPDPDPHPPIALPSIDSATPRLHDSAIPQAIWASGAASH